MTTKFGRKFCNECDGLTRHKIEFNRETGWRRERCMDCWNKAVGSTEDD